MKTIISIIMSVIDSAKHRLKNPIIGSFITSWILFNWKIVLILMFSDKTIEYKIAYIEIAYVDFNNLFVFPIATSLFYFLLLPYLTGGIEFLLKGVIAFRKRLIYLQEIEDIQHLQVLAAEE